MWLPSYTTLMMPETASSLNRARSLRNSFLDLLNLSGRSEHRPECRALPRPHMAVEICSRPQEPGQQREGSLAFARSVVCLKRNNLKQCEREHQAFTDSRSYRFFLHPHRHSLCFLAADALIADTLAGVTDMNSWKNKLRPSGEMRVRGRGRANARTRERSGGSGPRLDDTRGGPCARARREDASSVKLGVQCASGALELSLTSDTKQCHTLHPSVIPPLHIGSGSLFPYREHVRTFTKQA